MRIQKIQATALAAVIVCSLIPRPGNAQVVPATPMPGTTRGSAFGYLGITNVSCNCTFMIEDNYRSFTFRSNPVVLGVYSGSPADGALQRGDTITGIDGIPLKTEEGGRRLANIQPGQRVTLNVARGKSHMTLILKSSSVSFGDARAFGSRAPEAAGSAWSSDFPATPAVPAVPGIPAAPSVAPIHAPSMVWVGTTPRAVVAPAPPGVTYTPVTPASPVAPVATVPEVPPVPAMASLPPAPSGWFGFSIRCSDCGWAQNRGEESPVWELSSAPELSMVASDGPAARAGLMAGDKITHVNGISILTPQGGRAFGRVRPGEKVRLTVLRNGKSITRELTLATRPEARAVIYQRNNMPRPAAVRRELRYTGQLDNVSVEVWSTAGPSIERTGDTITISVGTSVIRLKAK